MLYDRMRYAYSLLYKLLRKSDLEPIEYNNYVRQVGGASDESQLDVIIEKLENLLVE